MPKRERRPSIKRERMQPISPLLMRSSAIQPCMQSPPPDSQMALSQRSFAIAVAAADMKVLGVRQISWMLGTAFVLEEGRM